MNRKILLLLLALLLFFAFGCKKTVDSDTDISENSSESPTDISNLDEDTVNEPGKATENEGGTASQQVMDTISPDATDKPHSGVIPNDGKNAEDSGKSEESESTMANGDPTVSVPENYTTKTEDDKEGSEANNDGDSGDFKDCTYEEYHNMSAIAQQEFFAKFGSYEAFFEWYNAAKDEYEKAHPENIIDGGEINLDELVGN